MKWTFDHHRGWLRHDGWSQEEDVLEALNISHIHDHLFVYSDDGKLLGALKVTSIMPGIDEEHEKRPTDGKGYVLWKLLWGESTDWGNSRGRSQTWKAKSLRLKRLCLKALRRNGVPTGKGSAQGCSAKARPAKRTVARHRAAAVG